VSEAGIFTSRGRSAALLLRAPAFAALGWTALLALVLAVAVVGALGIGRYHIESGEIVTFLLASAGLADMPTERYATLHNVIVDIRLPRIAAAVLVGAALASSGAAFQAVFRNPLVSPGLLGVLAGASFGAALGIVLDASWGGIQWLAFLMGLAAVAIGVGIASLFAGASLIMLVLGGMISSALFASLLSIVKYVADPMNHLPNIVYWLMGNLGQSDLGQVTLLAGPMVAGIVTLSLLGRSLDVLSMGDDEARSLGLPVTTIRYGTIALATLVSALTVSMAGMIGWVGLIIPHIARLALGASNTQLIPASALMGAIFLVATDALSRTMMDAEIPIGILTELLGIPVFLLVLGRSWRGWRE
jgi:iron complex transport system permease protein